MLHRHASFEQAAARTAWCVDERAIGVITGEVGVGKTAAVRSVLTTLDASRHSVIYISNPAVGVRGIHMAIVTALGGAPAHHTATLIPQTADALAAEHHERGKTPVIVLDEAHLLSHQQLEAVRMLTNHDMDSRSPAAVLLIGQPTLKRQMRLGVLAALEQRILLRPPQAPRRPRRSPLPPPRTRPS
jgi:type II secretory pathway predicted ATPase ExeA